MPFSELLPPSLPGALSDTKRRVQDQERREGSPQRQSSVSVSGSYGPAVAASDDLISSLWVASSPVAFHSLVISVTSASSSNESFKVYKNGTEMRAVTLGANATLVRATLSLSLIRNDYVYFRNSSCAAAFTGLTIQMMGDSVVIDGGTVAFTVA